LKTLTFRYANGSATNRECQLRVNGILIGTVTFAPTGSWTTWATVSVSSVAMVEGYNIVNLRVSTANGGPNLDKMEVQ